MKIGRIIHQQIVQLRWQFLACLGLIMVMPIEEAFVNLKEGDGFYSLPMVAMSICFAPLLAGLIACANIQADLDDKRHLFWRSKPVGVKSFMTIKYFVGLLISMVLLTCPVLFAVISIQLCDPQERFLTIMPVFFSVIFISIMTYSLCFFANVLVRKTARAWLIGMAITCFLLLIPFMLPLNYKDVATYLLLATSAAYLTVTLGASAVAFFISLIAASRNWHLQTNLKGLLWTVAALIFLLMMLFTSQVANIKVLDEVDINNHGIFWGTTDRRAVGDYFVNVQDRHIELEAIEKPTATPVEMIKINAVRLYKVEEGLRQSTYPRFWDNKLLYKSGSNTFSLKLNQYFREETISPTRRKTISKHLYLDCDKLIGPYSSTPAAFLDLSDLIHDGQFISSPEMRLIGDKLVIVTKENITVVKINDQGRLQLLENNKNQLGLGLPTLIDRNKIFKIFLIDTQQISIEDRIKLSIDCIHCIYDFPAKSIVDINGDQISFMRVTGRDVARFDVVKWDDKFVYCKFNNSRPFTFLEQMLGNINFNVFNFVKDGQLYVYDDQQLMVFDVRSDRIRKLGHFERTSETIHIRDIEVHKEGVIILASTITKILPDKNNRYIFNSKIYLLKNPK